MPKPTATKRRSRVNLPETAEERALIQRAAQARGMPAATFARAVALADLPGADT